MVARRCRVRWWAAAGRVVPCKDPGAAWVAGVLRLRVGYGRVAAGQSHAGDRFCPRRPEGCRCGGRAGALRRTSSLALAVWRCGGAHRLCCAGAAICLGRGSGACQPERLCSRCAWCPPRRGDAVTARRVSIAWVIGLWAGWLLLQGDASVGNMLLGLPLAYLIAYWLAPKRALQSHIRIVPVIRLIGRVAWDIPASNLAVAWLVLTRPDHLKPAWISVPLALPDDVRVQALAAIVSLTPGTLSVDYDVKTARLQVHVLDTDDAEAVAQTIKTRYESLLLEIYA
nr:Na+/H+ antiporter subunit E [Niveibacterium sp. COAC-50]